MERVYEVIRIVERAIVIKGKESYDVCCVFLVRCVHACDLCLVKGATQKWDGRVLFCGERVLASLQNLGVVKKTDCVHLVKV